MNYIQVNQMDQNIGHSYPVLYNCIANIYRDSMFMAQTVKSVAWAV